MVVFHKSESAQTPNHVNFSTEVDVRSSQKPREKISSKTVHTRTQGNP